MMDMTTRSGHTWLVVYGVFGAYVARRDSPAARAAARDKLRVVRFRTFGEACRQARIAREVAA